MGLMTSLARGGPTLDGVEVPARRSVGGSAALSFPVLGAQPSASGMLVSQATAIGVATVRQCVGIRAGSLARCAPRLVPHGQRYTAESLADPTLDRLFRRPNRIQPWFNFAEFIAASLLMRSNAYIVKLRDGSGAITELIPVNPDLVQVLEAVDGSLFYQTSRIGLWLAAVLSDVPIAIPDYDVIHIRDLSFNALLGAARLSTGRDTIGLAISQEQQASRWAGSGARPAGILKTSKQLTEDAALRLKRRWEELNAGVLNAGRTAVLEDGLEWQQMQMNSVDLEFLKSREFQVREICRLFDVQPYMVGEAAGMAKGLIAELNADFVNRVVMNDVTRIEQALSLGLELADDREIMLDHRELLRADLSTQMDLARKGFLSGLVSQNEGRAQIGQPRRPEPEADRLYPPTNLAPNGSAIDGVAGDGAGRPKDGEDPAP